MNKFIVRYSWFSPVGVGGGLAEAIYTGVPPSPFFSEIEHDTNVERSNNFTTDKYLQ